MSEERYPIKFHFHPHENCAIEKSVEGGAKRRYLKGISSGVNEDEHGERMTQQCIKSFHEQATSGDVLLYADVHGIRYSDDIGILTDHEIDGAGNWITEYRLYDQGDGIDVNSISKADKLWKQINGFAPYRKPKQKGFSIEGFIPNESVIKMNERGKRVIDNVVLEGVVIVPRPAYKDSVAHAIYKALGEYNPWQIDNSLKKALTVDQIEKSYFQNRYHIEDMLHNKIEEIMYDNRYVDKEQILNKLFDEYKALSVEIIMKSQDIFLDNESLFINKDVKLDAVFKSLQGELNKLSQTLMVGGKNIVN